MRLCRIGFVITPAERYFLINCTVDNSVFDAGKVIVVIALWITFPAGVKILITWRKKSAMVVVVMMQGETTMSDAQCFKKES